MSYLIAAQDALLYLVAALVLLFIATSIYVRVTPHAEFALIRNGNAAAAIALVGALIGLALPLASSIYHTNDLLEMLLWSVFSMVTQSVAYFAACKLDPDISNGITQGNLAHGIWLGGLSAAVGLINAACVS